MIATKLSVSRILIQQQSAVDNAKEQGGIPCSMSLGFHESNSAVASVVGWSARAWPNLNKTVCYGEKLILRQENTDATDGTSLHALVATGLAHLTPLQHRSHPMAERAVWVEEQVNG